MYSRAALLEWARHNAPDLRIGRAVIDGKLECFARFTWAGTVYELEAAEDDAADAIVRKVVEALREVMGQPPLFTKDDRDALPQRIVAAAIAGDETTVQSLTHRLVTERAKSPRAIEARPSFSKREVW